MVKIMAQTPIRCKLGFIVFAFFYILLNLHMLRNVSSIYPAFLAIMYFSLILYAASKANILKINGLIVCYLIFLATALEAALHTMLLYGVSGGLSATVRYLFTAPVAYLAFSFLEQKKDVTNVFKIFVYIIAIGSLTVPLQYLIGPISWFADPSERGGLIRYASIFGSLTVLGSVIPVAFYILFYIDSNKLTKALLSIMLLSGALMTLQKSAIVGIILSTVVYLYIEPAKFKSYAKVLIIILIVFSIMPKILSIQTDEPWMYALRYIVASAGLGQEYGGTSFKTDDTVQESAVLRLTELPANSLKNLHDLYGFSGYIWGGSFGMMGPALMREGESPYIMPHNNFVDFMVIGGILHLLSFIGILFYSTKYLRLYIKQEKKRSDTNSINKIMYGVIIIFIINLPFTSNQNIHPNISSLFWIIVGIVYRQKLINTSKLQAIKITSNRGVCV